jgi:2,4-dienoyl-CoA reductase-like NADH-dependent reductase (Old Yellow Enzyme family)
MEKEVDMSKLFEQTSINSMTLQNRFIRSATWEAMATDEGLVTPDLSILMACLAEGGVGLIISGHAYVSPEGLAGPRQLGVFQDEQIPGLTDMARAVHAENGKIILQLAHAGCMAAEQLSGLETLGPSQLKLDTETRGRAMTRGEIQATVAAFGRAAGMAKAAGLDGVQIHGAHGYLISQFLSPFFNRREDEYGGSLENRARFVLEVLGSVREQTGPEFPVLIKMNSDDFLPDGFSVDDMLKVAVMLEKAGIDAIELSGGTGLSGQYTPVRKWRIEDSQNEAYYDEAALRFKETVGVPLILVGGIRSFETAESLVDNQTADYIALSRPLIREPDLIRRWQQGRRRRSACLSDNLCFVPTTRGEGVYCVTTERQDKKGQKNETG